MKGSRPAELRAIAPGETAVLTPAELARWLQISERQLERLDDEAAKRGKPGIPWVTFGKRSRRALVRSVLTWLQSRRAGDDDHA